MRIITLTCQNCGTVVAGNVLEEERIMTCPGIDCEAVLSFQELPDEDRDHIEAHRDRYRMG